MIDKTPLLYQHNLVLTNEPKTTMSKHLIKLGFLFIGLFSIFSAPQTLYSQAIYISPSGDDQSPGSRDKPLATWEGAKKAVRKKLEEKSRPREIHVVFQEGIYFMDEPVSFGSLDSHKDTKILYQGEQGKTVEFIGGRKITNLEKVNDELWKANLHDLGDHTWHFEQLYVNSKRAVRARTPNVGEYFNVVKVEENIISQGNGRVAEKATQKVSANPEDLASMTREDMDGALVTFYHKWDNTRKYLESFDPSTSSFQISGSGMQPWNVIDHDSRFFIDNIRLGLDSPGEWFLEKNGTLYYIPREGERIEETDMYAPVIEQFILIQGEGLEDKLIENISFENLSFKVAGYTTPPQGNEAAQAAAPIENVVMVDYAQNITFKNCEFAHTGLGGIWFREASSYNSVEQCYFHDLGAGGIKIGALNVAAKAEDIDLISNNNIIDNNIIRTAGLVFPCAVGIAIFHSSDNQITHNEIADLRYTGISVGWIWGYSHSHAKRNIIKYNHIHHLGWGDLSDMGGVYTLGASEGTEVNNNVIHHVYSMTYGGWGLYTDEGSTGILMENNLVYACKSAGFHQHYGKDNIIRNNIFAYNILSQLQATRVEEHTSFSFTNNIVLFNTGSLTSSNWDKIKLRSNHNIYWDERGSPVEFGSYSFLEWQKKGNDTHSRIMNPEFKNPREFDFRFKRKRNIRKAGFKIFDPSEAGVYGEKEWVQKARFDPELSRLFDEIVLDNESE